MNTVQNFRIIAIIEGLTYLGFAITMPLKYLYQITEPNYIVGMLHGIVFIIYCFWLLALTIQKKWSWLIGIKLFIASLIPCGTFYMDRKYLKEFNL